MLSNWMPPTTLEAMHVNMVWDGLFHAVVWLVTLVGVFLLWNAAYHQERIPLLREFVGQLLFGWGWFNLVEGLIDESREMLGIVDQLRYNGLDHSPATRIRRSSRMRVKLQLVLCSDEGHEEAVTDVMMLNKNNQRYRNGEAIATGFVESTVNQVVSKCFCKKQQMQWSKPGAHVLLQTRVKTLDGELGAVFTRWYSDMDLEGEEMPAAA